MPPLFPDHQPECAVEASRSTVRDAGHRRLHPQGLRGTRWASGCASPAGRSRRSPRSSGPRSIRSSPCTRSTGRKTRPRKRIREELRPIVRHGLALHVLGRCPPSVDARNCRCPAMTMRRGGLEPPSLAAPDPKSPASLRKVADQSGVTATDRYSALSNATQSTTDRTTYPSAQVDVRGPSPARCAV
jgi:hypothetical protein